MIDEELQSAINAVRSEAEDALKDSDLLVHIEGQQKWGYRGGVRHRVIEITLSGEEMQQFLANPSYEALADAYGLHESFFTRDPEAMHEDSVYVESIHIKAVARKQ